MGAGDEEDRYRMADGSELVGGVRLLPSLSDGYLQVADMLADVAQKHPDHLGAPAAALLIAAAGVESYLNELIEITFPNEQAPERRRLLGYGTDVLRKVETLKELAKAPDELSEAVIEDVRLWVGLRGLLAHYVVQPEHPTQTRTSFQRLHKRLDPAQTPDLAVSALLPPETGRWATELFRRVVKELYNAGYEPPRPRWFQLVGLRDS